MADEDFPQQPAVLACYLAVSGARVLVKEENLLGPTYHGSGYGLCGDGGSTCYELLPPWGSPINLLARGGIMRERASKSKREHQIHLQHLSPGLTAFPVTK